MKPTKEKTMEAICLQSSLQFGETLKSVSDSDYRRLRDNYDALLKQPLKLEMFVPCDEIIEVMNYKEIKQSVIEGTDSWDAYEKAKEKVLFEYKPQFDLGIIKHHISQGRNIEYLANFGSMQLTKFALNAIFG